MRIRSRVITSLAATLIYTVSFASSLPSRSSGSADNFAANSNKTMNSKDTKSAAPNTREQEATAKIFENYQHFIY